MVIFGADEGGSLRPVVAAVAPLSGGRLVESPFHAARFVSLLPYRRAEGLVGSGGPASRSEVWPGLFTTLALKQGDVEGHAALLCSLLLGFGLEAYVVVGACPYPYPRRQ